MEYSYQQPNRPRDRRSTLVVVCLLITFGAGFFLGDLKGLRRSIPGGSEMPIKKLLDTYGKSRSDSVSFNEFWQVWDAVKSKYVVQPVDEVKMFYGAIEGMVAGLDDPYSMYFPPVEAEEFAKDLAGEFEGIGAEIGKRSDQLVITAAPIRGTPAERAGLRHGDKIFSINDEDTARMELDEAVSKIRGKKGTPVVLAVGRTSKEESRAVRVVRDTIVVPTVTYDMKDAGIAYIRLSYFNEATSRSFDSAVSHILSQSPSALILDMRGNPGGYLESAVDVASRWIVDGVVVQEQFQNDERNDIRSRGPHPLRELRTIVLVDGGTASAAEIVSGALRDHGKATLVGQKTYGKGSVQDLEAFPDGSALKITVAKWLTPKGQQIDKEGIAPDVALEKVYEDVLGKDGKPTGEQKDVGLEKAIEMLKK